MTKYTLTDEQRVEFILTESDLVCLDSIDAIKQTMIQMLALRSHELYDWHFAVQSRFNKMQDELFFSYEKIAVRKWIGIVFYLAHNTMGTRTPAHHPQTDRDVVRFFESGTIEVLFPQSGRMIAAETFVHEAFDMASVFNFKKVRGLLTKP